MLRIFVFGLVLANILLIVLNLLQSKAGDSNTPEEKPVARRDLPRIDLVPPAAQPDPDVFWQPANELGQGPEIDPVQVSADDAEQGMPENPGQVAEEVPADVVAAPAQPVSLMCIRLGPFDSAPETAAAKAELEQFFERVLSFETRNSVERGYWVFIPPGATREESEKELGRLVAAGIKDYYLVPRGKMANAIALGVYDQMARAESRQSQLMELDLGLNVLVERQNEETSQFWLDAGPANEQYAVPDQWSLSHPDAQQSQIPCPLPGFESLEVLIKGT